MKVVLNQRRSIDLGKFFFLACNKPEIPDLGMILMIDYQNVTVTVTTTATVKKYFLSKIKPELGIIGGI